MADSGGSGKRFLFPDEFLKKGIANELPIILDK